MSADDETAIAERAEPTTAELKQAWQLAGLWRLGITFRRALEQPPVLAAMRCTAIAHRKTNHLPEQIKLGL